MKLRAKQIWALAYTAVFAVLAGFVFWGTWSCDVAPVMPDCPVAHPLGYWNNVVRILGDFCFRDCQFIPDDLQVFVGTPYFRQELQYAFAVFMSGLAVAYYCLGRGMARPVAYGAALFLAFSGYWFTLYNAGHGSWFRWLTYGVFAFGLCDRALTKGRAKHWLLLGAVLAWASRWQPDLWLIFTILTGAYFVWCCVRERKFPSWKGLALAALSAAVIGAPNFRCALTGALQSRDDQIKRESGSALTGGAGKSEAEERWIFVTNWSLPPEESLEFFIPRLNGDTSCPMTIAAGQRAGTGVKPYTGALGRPLGATRGNYRQHSLYVGWMTCLLALVGIVLSVRRRRDLGRTDVWFFLGAALVCWLLSMGRYCEPVYRVFYAMPFGNYLRAPVKWHHLTEFCLVILAGYGLAEVKRLCDALPGATGKLGTGLVVALALIGAGDLAKNAKYFCAPIDLRLVKAANPAADDVKKLGGGKVADFIEGGHGLVSWAFSTRDVEMVGNPTDEGVRFIWLSAEQANDAKVKAYLAAQKAQLAGYYQITMHGVRRGQPGQANAVLMHLPQAKMPPEKPQPVRTPLMIAMGLLSLLGTVSVSAYAIRKA